MSERIAPNAPRETQRIRLSRTDLSSLHEWAVEGTALTAVARVRDQRGRIALVENHWSDGWILPGGAVEPGETPAEAARREVREETGLRTTVGDALVVLDQTYVDENDGSEAFTAQYVVYDARATGEIPDATELGEYEDEISVAQWFETLPEQLHDGDILRSYLSEPIVFSRPRQGPSMDSVLIIGGTRFIGRATVEAFREHGYGVTICNRGNHANPFADDPAVTRVEADRRDRDDLEAVAQRVDPDAVIDCVAYYPEDVRAATAVFADVAAYVYVSSGASYGVEEVPKREGDTPLCACTPEQATTDSAATYGPRKAEGDRAVFAAAERGVRAMSVRPTVVYGPHDYTERFDYWIDRVDSHESVVVPGDGLSLWQLAFVEDVASALRIVAEEGTAGEAYNVGDEDAPTLGQWIDLLADACDTEVRQVGVSERELAREGLEPNDFPIYRDPPHLLSTAKLRSLGWSSTPHDEALARTVAEHRESDRTGRDEGPDREREAVLLESLLGA